MALQASRTTQYTFVVRAAALAGIIACGDSTAPDGPGAADLPIVYSYSSDGGTPDRDLFLTSADGRTTRPLPDLGGDEAHPAWKPDGRELLVSRTTSATQVLLIDQQGSNVRTVPDVDGMARWSPDGAWIAFTNGASSLLGIVRPDGSGRRVLANVGDGARIAHPSWGRIGDSAFTCVRPTGYPRRCTWWDRGHE
jgi:Tol biopolymer transport system component